MRNNIKFPVRALLSTFIAVIVFAFAGCAKPAAINTETYSETVDGTLWEVTYNADTREIVSIKTPLVEFIDMDTQSEYYNFMVEYRGNSNVDILHAATLTGKPISNNVFRIERVESYQMDCSRAEYEAIKEAFPNSTYEETPTSSIITDPITGTTSTVTHINTSVTFATSKTTYEQTLIFNVPSANQ